MHLFVLTTMISGLHSALKKLILLWLCSFGMAEAATVTLKWIAPGDDNNTGRALLYDVRYARFPVIESNWDDCLQVDGVVPTPMEAGSLEQMDISGLEDRALYFFAIKTVDDAGNWSPVSRLATFALCEEGCIGIRGNVSADPHEQIDITDLVFLVSFLFSGGPAPACPMEGDINGDNGSIIDVTDLSYLVDFLFNSNAPAPPGCPGN